MSTFPKDTRAIRAEADREDDEPEAEPAALKLAQGESA